MASDSSLNPDSPPEPYRPGDDEEDDKNKDDSTVEGDPDSETVIDTEVEDTPDSDIDRMFLVGQTLAVGGLIVIALGIVASDLSSGYQFVSTIAPVVGLLMTAASVFVFVRANLKFRQKHTRHLHRKLDAIHDDVNKSQYERLIEVLENQRRAAEELQDELPNEKINELNSKLGSQDETIEEIIDQIEKAERKKLEALKDIKN